MSRCFPFPPPGYEKRLRSNHVDLLTKGKHREKKHKKEKKERENREGKEKKVKDRSKDKHKEKKERREKHRERKSDKDGDKDKAWTSSVERSESQAGFSHGDGGLKAVEARDDTKFMVELGRRIKDEKGAATQMEERERIAVNKLLTNPIHSDQRRKIRPEQKINSTHSVQGLPVGPVSEPATRKGKTLALGNLTDTEQSRNGGTFKKQEKNMVYSQRRPEGPNIINVPVAEKGPSDQKTSSSIVGVRKTIDGMGPLGESSSGSIYRKTEGMGFNTPMAKENNNNFILAQGGNNGMGIYMEKIVEKGTGRIEKSKERGADRDKEEKKREGKDRHKDKEKEKEKKREKGECSNKERDETSESRGQIDSLSTIKPLPLQNDNERRAGADEDTKKRKEFETNGFLHENDMPCTKFARTIPSHVILENGRTLPSNKFAPSASIKPSATYNVKAERLQDNKEHHLNGITEAQLVTNTESEVSVPLPHPDTKYLNQVYSVPKMEEWLEQDEQEWLFCSDCLRSGPATKLPADKPPEVWTEAIQIESEDVIALPYIIPL